MRTYYMENSLQIWDGLPLRPVQGGRFGPLKRLLVSCVSTIFLVLALLTAGILATTRPIKGVETVEYYEEWLGQPVLHLTSFGVVCTAGKASVTEFPGVRYCMFKTASGPIDEVVLRVSRQIVVEVILLPREKALELGDLIERWGRPEIDSKEHALSIRWPDRRISATTDAKSMPLSYRAKIGWLSIAVVTRDDRELISRDITK